MADDDGSLSEDLRVAVGLILDDVREEIRFGIRRLFDHPSSTKASDPPTSVAPPSKKVEIPVTKEVIESPPLKSDSQ